MSRLCPHDCRFLSDKQIPLVCEFDCAFMSDSTVSVRLLRHLYGLYVSLVGIYLYGIPQAPGEGDISV